MSSLTIFISFFLAFNISLLHPIAASSHHEQIINFYKCVNSSTSNFYYPKNDLDSFTSILNSTAQNLRCLSEPAHKPSAIFTPSTDPQVQAAVRCAVRNRLHARFRSGGHDFEGLSYTSLTENEPFILVDLRKIRHVEINITSETAWVDSGVTLGELYYKISEKSGTHAFPAGICTDLGIGGHVTGGGYGSLMRKYGLSIDNVLDAEIVEASGRILDRGSMGEDLFWAIRGGGGSNFAVILRWKIRLVRVPRLVTVFAVRRTASPRILMTWQTVAPSISDELFLKIDMVVPAGENTTRPIITFQALYLGEKNELLNLTKTRFPELGLQKTDFVEMKWIESVMFMAGFDPTTTPPKTLLNPTNPLLTYFKAKSDFVEHPISEEGIENMLSVFGEEVTARLRMIVWTPYGGEVSRISENETAFAQRKVLFKILYVVGWDEEDPETRLEHETWIGKLYDRMADYVTKKPRRAYVNYRDLDIGRADPGRNLSCPGLWGPKYYKNNYRKLVKVKTRVDSKNVFRNEQSIPTASMAKSCIPFDVRTG